jgi:DNA-binding winged helix-turn-helix (wHTH) protein/tetratricopeptide (TPR) repeat protein
MNKHSVFHFGRYRLSPATRELSRDGQALSVPARVFDCVAYLIENRARAVGRDELGAAVWGKADISEAQLTQTILRARRLLDDDTGDQGHIRTIPRFGYHWVCAVHVEGHETTRPTGPSADASRPPRRFSARLGWSVLALAALFVGSSMLFLHKPAPRPVPERAAAPVHGGLVLPIENSGNDDYAWVRLGAIDVVADRLRGAGLAVPATETTLALLEGSGAVDTKALLRSAGTQWVVSSRVDRSARGWRATLQAADNAGNERKASAEAADVLAAVRDGTDVLIEQLGLTPAKTPPRDPAVEEILQRAQAAMLENDFDTAQRLLTAAPAAVAARPELRYQLAALAFRAGRLDEAESDLHRLLGDESGAGDPLRRAQIHYGLGAIAMMRDRANDAEREFERSLATLDRRLQPLDYGKALGGRGGARFTLGRYQEGLDDLGGSRTLLEQSGDRLALARMNIVYGAAQLQYDRAAQAVPVLTAALAQLEPFGAINERAHAYSALCNAQLELLDYAAAQQANDEAWTLLPRIGDPLNRAETLTDRLSLLRVQGRHEAMTPVFADLDALDLSSLQRMDGRRDSVHADFAWDQGHTAAALVRAEAAIAKLRPYEPDAAAHMALLRQRTLLALGRREQAVTAMAVAASAPPPMPIEWRLAQAELAASGDAPATAEPEFAAVLAEAESRNLPAQTLQVAESMIPYLIEQGRIDSANALLGRLAPTASQDFGAALLRVRVHQAAGRIQAWADALRQARTLAGERSIPAELQQTPPPVGALAEPSRTVPDP